MKVNGGKIRLMGKVFINRRKANLDMKDNGNTTNRMAKE